MTIEFPEAVKSILRAAARQRRLYRRTKEGKHQMIANALQQYAGRVRRAVPSDPDSEDLSRLAREMTADAVDMKPSKLFLFHGKREEVRGRPLWYAHLDDFTYYDRDDGP